jgi:hypothetical protein
VLMTTLDYEVNMAYNRQRVAEIRDSVRTVEQATETHRNVTLLIRLRLGLGGLLIAAGQQICGNTIRCQMPRQTVVGRASS